MNQKSSPAQSTKMRKREKKIISRIQEQLEFYFSDANLRKDRFLNQIMEKSDEGFVEIDVISSFNRLKVLAGKAENLSELIIKAIQNSSLLVINKEGKGVKRSKPLEKEKYNIDDLTIYVEKLPSDASHDWVKSLFSSCGTVTYISLPRYKSTGDIKGFAFVEFETPLQAAEACAKFNLQDDNDSNDEVIGNFPKTKGGKYIGEWQNSKLKQTNDNNLPKIIDKVNTKKKSKKSEPNTKKTKKGKLKLVTQLKFDEIQSKESLGKKTIINSESLPVDNNLKINESRKRKRENITKDSSEIIKKRKIEYLDEKILVKKKRKRHKAIKDKGKKEKLKLRVISKHEWLLLKKQYLEAQKKNMSNLKQVLVISKEETSTLGKDISTRIGFDTDNRPIPTKPKELEYTEGVIVKIKSTVPINSRKELKEKLSSIAPVAYIDLNDGDTEGHVRFKYAEDAKCVLNKYGEDSNDAHFFSVSLLKDKEEKSYWDKLFADKNKKLNSKEKRKQRGMEKILKKVVKCSRVAKKSEKLEESSSHIWFDHP